MTIGKILRNQFDLRQHIGIGYKIKTQNTSAWRPKGGVCPTSRTLTYIHAYIHTYIHTYILDVFLTVHHELTIYWSPTFVHWLLFIHKILISSTCFEPQVLIFRRIQLYTCSTWYCHSLWEFLVACRYTAWVRTDCRGKVVGRAS